MAAGDAIRLPQTDVAAEPGSLLAGQADARGIAMSGNGNGGQHLRSDDAQILDESGSNLETMGAGGKFSLKKSPSSAPPPPADVVSVAGASFSKAAPSVRSGHSSQDEKKLGDGKSGGRALPPLRTTPDRQRRRNVATKSNQGKLFSTRRRQGLSGDSTMSSASRDPPQISEAKDRLSGPDMSGKIYSAAAAKEKKKYSGGRLRPDISSTPQDKKQKSRLDSHGRSRLLSMPRASGDGRTVLEEPEEALQRRRRRGAALDHRQKNAAAGAADKERRRCEVDKKGAASDSDVRIGEREIRGEEELALSGGEEAASSAPQNSLLATIGEANEEGEENGAKGKALPSFLPYLRSPSKRKRKAAR